jgi:predicted TIM-barrel fold metal-dependent hydrolase
MIIDLDSHLREIYFMDEVYKLEGRYAQYTPVKINNGMNQRARFQHNLDPVSPKARAAVDHRRFSHKEEKWRGGEEYANRQVGGYDMEERMKALAAEGIDTQILFPTTMSIPAMNYGNLGVELCRAVNNWMAKLVKGREDRLWPVAIIPAGCPDQMAGELKRCVHEFGFRAGHLVPYCGPRNLDDPAFFSYYETAEELNVPLFCHPNTNGELTDRFNDFFAMHVLGRPNNCTAGLVGLLCGGVFEKFPKLKVAFFECTTEWLVYWMHRMDDDYEWLKNDHAKHLTMLPSEYIKRNCWVTCEADEKFLKLGVEELGEDRICFATDYPHYDSEYPNTVRRIKQRTDITNRQKELILGGNAARLLNLE